MRTNYVLIDYENVQPESLSGLDAEHFHVILFVGANQSKLSFGVVDAMQALGARGRYVKVCGVGPNALDFHIAFYIGQLAAQDANAYFHVISKDTGFDPLIEHLKIKKVPVIRSKSIAEIPVLRAANSKSLLEKVAVAVTNLQQRGTSRPRTLKTLSSTLSSLFQKQLADEELADLVQALQREGFVNVAQEKVSYTLPPLAAH